MKFRVTVTGTFTRTGVVEAESEIDEDMGTDSKLKKPLDNRLKVG